jgi:catechol 2,3-dioxygenase-like lactoylglutathione lyase family enzyme
MFDHVTIRVSDRAISQLFYATVLSPLGLETTRDTAAIAMWQDFMLSQANDTRPVTLGLHIAFVAPSRERVDAFWQAGIDAGHAEDGPPGPRPQYGEDYYAAFLRDPDGNGVEAVHRGAARPGEGVVDHLTIRVRDLPAASAFYRMLAAVAGFDVAHEGPERTTLADVDSGRSFSLLAGTPTANLHVAFPASEDAVRRFHSDAVAAGYRSNGEPGERPHYHPGYYAAFVLDPDGNNIELVDHHGS